MKDNREPIIKLLKEYYPEASDEELDEMVIRLEHFLKLLWNL